MSIGNSLYDEDGAKIVEKLVEKAKSKNVKLHFPIDFITADKVQLHRITYTELRVTLGYFSLMKMPKLVLRLSKAAFPMVGWDLTVALNRTKHLPQLLLMPKQLYGMDQLVFSSLRNLQMAPRL